MARGTLSRVTGLFKRDEKNEEEQKQENNGNGGGGRGDADDASIHDGEVGNVTISRRRGLRKTLSGFFGHALPHRP
ncbi:hypothetical protein CH63R_09863 [Colletotrichum higginsianum IMI 349063]|uniref:Uncharacterized protein n=1 Tax=Colletotrichum higginsianum (strain IMI 349063) TaxID=759273 RepID=A0A1B7Y157_COLHI|nr:uncharacterized protein CH63R_09863 [Colletotrichum higginsianum IMI 349063]OBR05743.1 hypothetical protein CH63R_09863 [Colletotrichum higginsianum IMI 349063]